MDDKIIFLFLVYFMIPLFFEKIYANITFVVFVNDLFLNVYKLYCAKWEQMKIWVGN